MNDSSILWDEEEDKKPRAEIKQSILGWQNELAEKSKVFGILLNYEREDPNEVGTTNDTKSPIRNAMIIRSVYESLEEWEEELLTNSFYAAAFDEHAEIEEIRNKAGLNA